MYVHTWPSSLVSIGCVYSYLSTQHSGPSLHPLTTLLAPSLPPLPLLQEFLPIVHVLCNPGLRQRHWDKFSATMGINISPDSSTTLRKMLKNDFGPYLEEFESISASASKEHSLEKAMQKMVDEWDEISFNTTMYRDTGVWGGGRGRRRGRGLGSVLCMYVCTKNTTECLCVVLFGCLSACLSVCWQT